MPSGGDLPCKRCRTGGHECIFEESNRGKRSSKKHELLTRSLKKMEHTLDTVLRSLSNPHLQSLASGMVSRSPSPGGGSREGSSEPTEAQSAHSNSQSLALTRQTQNLTSHDSSRPTNTSSPGTNDATTPTIAVVHPPAAAPTSPKLHSLPDNALNPLGLLAEASLANRREKAVGVNSSDKEVKVGVANDTYFKPGLCLLYLSLSSSLIFTLTGPMTILPLRRLYIERQVQPEMLSFVSTEEVVELFKMFVAS
jgi:hypothetical protein